jgi:hypothetical protein
VPHFGRRAYLFTAIVLLIVVGLATGTGILAVRVGDLDRQLARTERRVSSLTPLLKEARQQAASSAAQAARSERTTKSLLNRLRRRPPCRGPLVWIFPSQGPIGTHVTITGYCFLGQYWRQWRGGYGMFLLHQFLEPRECELIIGVSDPVLRINRSGQAEGSFTVPGGTGGCFQHGYERRITPTDYSLGIACHACSVATFRVTSRRPVE